MLTSGAFGYPVDYGLWWVVYLSLLVHTWCFFHFFPRKRCRKLGLGVGNGLVFFCFLGLTALAGESYFRFVCVESDPFGWSVPAQRWFALYTKLNSLGCRDVEWTVEKPPGVRRIAFVGDSFTYGWGIERVEDRFPDRIQAMFDRKSRDRDPSRPAPTARSRLERRLVRDEGAVFAGRSAIGGLPDAGAPGRFGFGRVL